MCGIACCSGENAAKWCFGSLERLEYRGYDSVGIASVSGKHISVFKRQGRVGQIKDYALSLEATAAIAHTRWATHGKPTKVNAHPHLSHDRALAMVHNGIFENYQELKAELEAEGIFSVSETDTEVVLNFIASQSGKLFEKVEKCVRRVKGAFAFAILDRAGVLTLCAREMPLYVARLEKSIVAASDLVCLDGAEEFYLLKDGEVAQIDSGKVVFYSGGVEFEPTYERFAASGDACLLGKYSHFMEKEINEIPSVIDALAANYFCDRQLREVAELVRAARDIVLVGCGTAYHACEYGARLIEEASGIRARAFVASEFKYYAPRMDGTLAFFVSQSGETADTLGSLRLASASGAKTIAIVSRLQSAIAREADITLSACSGVEVAVASTKAFIAQGLVFFMLSSVLSGRAATSELAGLGARVFEIIHAADEFAETVAESRGVFILGRGLDSVAALEGALKIKEVTYKFAEGYAAGELKHGTIALVDESTPTFVVATQRKTLEKTLLAAEQVKARGGKVFVVSFEPLALADGFIQVPQIDERLAALISVVPFQMLAYKSALLLGLDPDKPRNLAKSVTVE